MPGPGTPRAGPAGARRASGWNTWLWPAIAVVMALAIVGLLVFRSASGMRVRLLVASVAG
ncbi:hypothetical protein EAO75_36785 [Streptomyces sp. uw30]|uniref:hypothetical protein n=1 Tax=Streptomyces sp. uw30 TaxID=1828179 RepID=UPI0011CDDD4D|nr:hypothetical protein [Streptomyces sp. uw30]TXS40514.1 hypothetical protein EAO75_36785 [Streptomyces sp. uw30]